MSEKHIGKVIQVIGPVLDIQFKDCLLYTSTGGRLCGGRPRPCPGAGGWNP